MQDTNVDCARKCEAVRTVSVAIVAHNEAQHFSNILEDVVAQDFPHNRIELLLIDSMSKDDTKQVMLEFKGLPFLAIRVKYFRVAATSLLRISLAMPWFALMLMHEFPNRLFPRMSKSSTRESLFVVGRVQRLLPPKPIGATRSLWQRNRHLAVQLRIIVVPQKRNTSRRRFMRCSAAK